MTRKLKPVEIPVPEPFRSAMLSVAVPDEHGQFTTVGRLVEEAREAIQRANEALATNSLVDLAAQDMMKGHRRRGGAIIEVGADGILHLRISYSPKRKNATVAPGGAGLPSLISLRQEADDLGVDITDLGRQKRKIMDRIEGVKGQPQDHTSPRRLRDEVTTTTPLHSEKLPPR